MCFPARQTFIHGTRQENQPYVHILSSCLRAVGEICYRWWHDQAFYSGMNGKNWVRPSKQPLSPRGPTVSDFENTCSVRSKNNCRNPDLCKTLQLLVDWEKQLKFPHHMLLSDNHCPVWIHQASFPGEAESALWWLPLTLKGILRGMWYCSINVEKQPGELRGQQRLQGGRSPISVHSLQLFGHSTKEEGHSRP